MKFRLLRGSHYEGEGKSATKYNATDGPRVIDTHRNLVKLYPNKFERIDEEVEVAKVAPIPETKPEPKPIKKPIVPEPEPEAPEEAESLKEDAKRNLIKKHKGGKRWVVLDEETGEQVHDGYLTKAQASKMVENQ